MLYCWFYFFIFSIFLSAGDLNKYVELLFNTDDLRWPLTSQHRLLTSFPASGEGDVRLTNIIISRRLIKNNHETNSGNSSHCRVSCRGSGRFSTADSSADAAFKDSGEIGSFMTMLPVNVKEKKTQNNQDLNCFVIFILCVKTVTWEFWNCFLKRKDSVSEGRRAPLGNWTRNVFSRTFGLSSKSLLQF